MKAKYVLSLSLTLTILLSSMQVAVAQKPELPNPGITPDSWMYGFKKFFEGIIMFFTFDDLAKAEKHVNYAGLRLREVKAMAERGKPEFVDFGDEISQIAQGLGKNTTTLEQLVAAATSVHLTVLA